MSIMKVIDYRVEYIVTQPDAEMIPIGVSEIQSQALWNEGYHGQGVVIAVFDTGVDFNHPDLAGVVVDGMNFTSDGDSHNYMDEHGHGTHVCGTIAAAQNGLGVVGVAPKARILMCKVLDSTGSGDFLQLAAAVNWALDWVGPHGEKVRIMSMSLGGPDGDPILHASLQRAVTSNVLVVCAAGNEGDGNAADIKIEYPSYYPEVVCVGAYNGFGGVAPFSNPNDQVDLIGPGTSIFSTYMGGQYAYLSGTSMATPHISGAAALVIDQFEKDYGRPITEPELFSQLIRRTMKILATPQQQGAGVIRLLMNYDGAALSTNDVTLAQAMAAFADRGSSNSPDYWLQKAALGNSIPGEMVALFIKKQYITLCLGKKVAEDV